MRGIEKACFVPKKGRPVETKKKGDRNEWVRIERSRNWVAKSKWTQKKSVFHPTCHPLQSTGIGLPNSRWWERRFLVCRSWLLLDRLKMVYGIWRLFCEWMILVEISCFSSFQTTVFVAPPRLRRQFFGFSHPFDVNRFASYGFGRAKNLKSRREDFSAAWHMIYVYSSNILWLL